MQTNSEDFSDHKLTSEDGNYTSGYRGGVGHVEIKMDTARLHRTIPKRKGLEGQVPRPTLTMSALEKGLWTMLNSSHVDISANKDGLIDKKLPTIEWCDSTKASNTGCITGTEPSSTSAEMTLFTNIIDVNRSNKLQIVVTTMDLSKPASLPIPIFSFGCGIGHRNACVHYRQAITLPMCCLDETLVGAMKNQMCSELHLAIEKY